MAARLPCSLTPSIVVISCPSQLAASMVQESMGTPSSCTVQAPQEESSQPRFEPVSCRSRRSASRRSLLASIASSYDRPLTRSSMSSFFILRLPALVQRNFRVDGARPAVDSAAHGLHFFESLLAQPIGDTQRAHAVMAHHDD